MVSRLFQRVQIPLRRLRPKIPSVRFARRADLGEACDVLCAITLPEHSSLRLSTAAQELSGAGDFSTLTRYSFRYRQGNAFARIAAAEFMNEPIYAPMGAAPKGYDAGDYGRDVAVFRAFLRKTSPDTLFLGSGSVGEGPFAMPIGNGVLKSEDLLKAAGAVFDVFSYHLHAAASERCASVGPRHKRLPRRRFHKIGSRDRKRLTHFRRAFETGLNRANHYGLRKPPMQRAEETLGLRLFWTRSATSFSTRASRSAA